MINTLAQGNAGEAVVELGKDMRIYSSYKWVTYTSVNAVRRLKPSYSQYLCTSLQKQIKKTKESHDFPLYPLYFPSKDRL